VWEGKKEDGMDILSAFHSAFFMSLSPALSPISSYFLSIPTTTLVYAITPERNRFSPYFLSVPFFFFFSLSFYSLLGFLLPFFNYTLLSISFSLFPFLFPFSYVYSRKTYTLSIQPFTLDPTDGQGPGWIW